MAPILPYLVTAAANAKNAYSLGQREREQEGLQNALQAYKLQQAAKSQAIQDALAQDRAANYRALEKKNLREPPPPNIDPNSQAGIDAAIAKAKGSAKPEAPDRTIVPVMEGNNPVYRPRAEAIGKQAPKQAQPTIPYVVSDPNDPTAPGLITTREQAIGQHVPSTSRESQPNTGERQAAALIPEIEDAQAKLDAVTPDLISEFASKAPLVGGYIKTDKGRQFQQLATQFINNTIIAKTGKAAHKDEIQRFYRELIPELGDEKDPQVLAQKKHARDLFIQGAYVMAGRAGKSVKPSGKGGGNPNQQPPAQPKASITSGERAALKAAGFTDAQLTAKYGPP